MSKGRTFRAVLIVCASIILFFFAAPLISGRIMLLSLGTAARYSEQPSKFEVERKNMAPVPFNYFDGKWPELLEKERRISSEPSTPLGRKIAAKAIIGTSFAGPILVILATGMGVSKGFRALKNKLRENQKKQLASRYKPPIYDVMENGGEN